jgi:hypothetical protein
MLFPRNALAPGPQACFLAENRLAKMKVGKQKDGIGRGRRISSKILRLGRGIGALLSSKF